MSGFPNSPKLKRKFGTENRRSGRSEYFGFWNSVRVPVVHKKGRQAGRSQQFRLAEFSVYTPDVNASKARHSTGTIQEPFDIGQFWTS